jgi:hypothetical protein
MVKALFRISNTILFNGVSSSNDPSVAAFHSSVLKRFPSAV